jgi:DNA helicase-2/ATP-dependent DNA helicase PcrA
MEEGLFPHSRSLTSEAAMEEERRLCYVGMTRAEKRLYLSSARYRRRFGGGQPEVSLPSRFLKEVPASLCERLSPQSGPRADEVDLYSEQHEVRDSAKRNLYNGKTYNSVDNIAQFFAERGMPPPSGFTRRPDENKQATAASVSSPTPPRAASPARSLAPRAGPLKNGTVIQHPKYGRGTILRREGDGDDAKLTVSFPAYGLKKIVEKYAGLKIEE